MPLYDYKCAACGSTAEVRHSFNESYSDPCAQCGGQMQRVFNPAPIVFKGSGFYVTDSKSKSSPKPSESSTTEPKPAESAKPAETPKSSSEPAA